MDRFGFTGEHSCVETKASEISVPRAPTPAEKRNAKFSAWHENKRTLKWLAMSDNWTVWSTKRRKVVKRRVRKGVPDAIRGKMWEIFCGADVLRHNAQTDRRLTYAATADRANTKCSQIKALMEKARAAPEQKEVEEKSKSIGKTTRNGVKDHLVLLSDEQKRSRKWDAVIEADLGRTFPDHCMFHRGATGQQVLRDVLRAYAESHPDLGYTQGMNFIVAMFLSYMPARDAYWVLTAVMDSPKWNLQSMFCDRTPAVARIWYQFDKLLAKYVPKVSAHFKKEDIHHSMYLTKWIIPLYTRDFHFDFVVRVWDIFLQQGWKIILRVALALLKQRQTQILSLDMENLMGFFRTIPQNCDAEATLKLAHRIKFKTKELHDLEQEFLSSQ